MIPTIKTGNARLLKLADFLEKLPRKRFNYRDWVGPDWKGAQNLSCGTKACALGWAASMPAFRRLGAGLKACPDNYMRMNYDDDFNNYKYKFMAFSLNGASCEPEELAEFLFSVDESKFNQLFIPNPHEGNATPKQVAKKIRKFVKGRSNG